MIKLTFKSDEGSRKGCHRVTLTTKVGKKRLEDTIFLIDEPGAWFDDKWNCHVDGMDFPFDTREQCICWGLSVLGYLNYEENGKQE